MSGNLVSTDLYSKNGTIMLTSCGTEVRRNTDTLEDGSSGDEGLDIGHGEGVDALLDGGSTGG